jgi:hypothetical protein
MSIYYVKSNIFYIFKHKKIINVNNSFDKSCNLIIIDNFYKNPDEVRNYALLQDFDCTGNFPGFRTIRSYENIELYEKISFYIKNLGYKIIDFNIDPFGDSNCSFTYSTSNDIPSSWIHVDDFVDDVYKKHPFVLMSGVLYLTPNAPLNSGTIFYEFNYHDNLYDSNIPVNSYTFDNTKWKKIDTVGNVYNRLVLFNGNIYHSIDKLFGTNKYNGRLTQNFFFICVKITT